jgi:hypothetical protein
MLGPRGALIIDDIGFLKKGGTSAGWPSAHRQIHSSCEQLLEAMRTKRSTASPTEGAPRLFLQIGVGGGDDAC